MREQVGLVCSSTTSTYAKAPSLHTREGETIPDLEAGLTHR